MARKLHAWLPRTVVFGDRKRVAKCKNRQHTLDKALTDPSSIFMSSSFEQGLVLLGSAANWSFQVTKKMHYIIESWKLVFLPC